MVVCRNWTDVPGSCRFGDRCRFDHPQANRGVSSSNPFAPLQRDNPNARNNNGFQTGGRALPFQLDKNQIITDLSVERPQWILSAYGPGRNAPEQLFGGMPREQSFEEMRVLHYIGIRSGNPQQAVQDAEKLVQVSEQQIHNVLSNVDGAIDFIINGENNHPNRIDIVRDSNSAAPQKSNAFDQGNNPNPFSAAQPKITSNAFGAPSQPVPSPAFGAPSMGAISGAFGQPSALGAKPNPFGQPSALGAKPNPFGAPSQAFGAPSQLGASAGAFGQPSALGQKANPFGPPLGGTGASGGFASFASPGAVFGKNSQPGAFGAPSQPATSNTFGGTSQSAPANAFRQPSGQNSNPFEANSQPAPANPFGAPSPASKSPFEAPSQPTVPNTFGGTAAQKLNPFSSPPPATANPFGNPQPNLPVATNPFSAPSTSSNQLPGNLFGNPALSPATNPLGGALSTYQPVSGTAQHPSLSTYATVGPNGRLTMFKGKRVTYRDGEPSFQRNDGSWEKIWFPQGAPPFYKDTEMDDAVYDEQTKAVYARVRQTGTFEGGVIPMLPPKRDWCLWDF